MRVYLAARYSRRDEMCVVAEKLNAVGVEVTSRWLAEQEALTSQMGDHSPEFYKYTATIDLEDINRANALIFFAEDPLVGIVRGGRHVEFGYALAKNKRIYVIDYRENVFHYIDGIKHYSSIEELIQKEEWGIHTILQEHGSVS